MLARTFNADIAKFYKDLIFNDGAGLPYGSLYQHETSQTVDISTAGNDVYVKITGFTTGKLNAVTINSDAFRVTYPGIYKVDYQVSANSGGTNVTYEFDLFVNGVEQEDGSSRRKFGTPGDNGSISGTAILDITSAVHDIDLRVKGVGQSNDVVIFNANFNVVMIGGT